MMNIILMVAIMMTSVIGRRRTRAVSLNRTPTNIATTQIVRTPVGINYRIGAPVMTGQVNIYHIYYGDWNDETASWNLNGAGKSLVEDFAQNVGTSSWYKTNRFYYSQRSSSSSRVYASNNIQYQGGVIDSYSLGDDKKILSDGEILQIVEAHIENFNGGVADPNGVYYVLTSPDITTSSGFCTKYCGWHTYATFSNVRVKYSFVGVPPRGCGCFGQKRGSPNQLVAVDAMMSIYAHELVETVSDPELNAWFDRIGYENADKCVGNWGTYHYTGSPKTGFYNEIIGSKKYLIQTNWDPTTGRCRN